MNILKINKAAVKSALIILCYIFSVAYPMIFNVLFNITKWPYTTVLIMAALAIALIMNTKVYTISKWYLVFVFFITINFAYSLIVYRFEITTNYLICFFTFGIFGILTGTYILTKAQIEVVIASISIIYYIYMYLAGGISDMLATYFSTGMAVLPGAISSILLSTILIKNRKVTLALVVVALQIYPLYIFISYCGRGVLISFLGAVVMMLILMCKNRLVKSIGVAISILSLFVINNFERFLTSGYNYFLNKGVDIYFFTKSIQKMARNNLTSGRDGLIEMFLQQDALNFIVGKGIAGFEFNNYDNAYIHNLILNFWSDYGAVGLAFILWILVSFAYIIAKDSDRISLYILLSGCCILELMFSYTYWRLPAFFLVVSIVFNRKGIEMENDNKYDASNKINSIESTR